MFKTATFYRLSPEFKAPDLAALNEAMALLRFSMALPSQESSHGWVPPRQTSGLPAEVDETLPLAEQVNGQIIVRMHLQRKAVPASEVKTMLAARCADLERQNGRKPGKKQQREMKEEIHRELLPRAFSKHSGCTVWIDPEAKLLVLSSSSSAMVDVVITALVACMGGAGSPLTASPVSTNMSAAAAMSHWLATKEAPRGFTVDRECELRLPDGEKSCVKYSRHSLELDEIGEHIRQGKIPVCLALTWGDKMSFVLTERGLVKKIEFLDIGAADGEEDAFDADVLIETSILAGMLPDLLEALGGEFQPDAAQPGAGGEAAGEPNSAG